MEWGPPFKKNTHLYFKFLSIYFLISRVFLFNLQDSRKSFQKEVLLDRFFFLFFYNFISSRGFNFLQKKQNLSSQNMDKKLSRKNYVSVLFLKPMFLKNWITQTFSIKTWLGNMNFGKVFSCCCRDILSYFNHFIQLYNFYLDNILLFILGSEKINTEYKYILIIIDLGNR